MPPTSTLSQLVRRYRQYRESRLLEGLPAEIRKDFGYLPERSRHATGL